MRKIIFMTLIFSVALITGCSSNKEVAHTTIEAELDTEGAYNEVDIVDSEEKSDTLDKVQNPVMFVEKFSNGERIGDIFKQGELAEAKNAVYDNLKSIFDIYLFVNPIDPILVEYATEERMEPYGLFEVFILQLDDKDIAIDDNSFEVLWGAASVDEMTFEVISGIKVVIADENGAINRVITMTKQ